MPLGLLGGAGPAPTFDQVALRSAGLSANFKRFGLAADSRIIFFVDEASEGNRDLNGDGDAIDRILHLLDPETFEVRNVGSNGMLPR